MTRGRQTRSPLLADKAEQEVLSADVVVPESTRLVNGELDHLLGARGEPNLTEHGTLATADDELHRLAHLCQLDVQVLKDLRRHAFPFAHEAEEEVLSADVVVVEALRLILGERQHLPGAVRKTIEAVSRGHALLRSPRECAIRSASARM